MKLYLSLLLCWLVSSVSLTAQRSTSADLERISTEILLSPPSGDLSKGDSITISFPVAMIPLDQVDLKNVPIPVRFTPHVTGDFTWSSTVTGTFRVTGPIAPGQSYQLDLAPNLNDSNGNPVPRGSWKPATFQTEPLEIETRFETQDRSLAALPEIELRINYDVTAADVREAAYFQDRAQRQRFAVAVILPDIDTSTANEDAKIPSSFSRFRVTPASPLPAGGTYDLIIEGLKDAGTGTPMPALQSFSLGSTQELEITKSLTVTHPLEKPSIILTTTGPIDPDTLTSESILISPTVANLTFFADTHMVRLQGDFDTAASYQVTLGPTVQSKTGYPITNRGPHQATFEGLMPVIVFPQSQFYQRSALGLRVTVLQSNCPDATWRLAKVPLEKLSVVETRLQEFQIDARDPFTGKYDGTLQTELLTEALSLEITAQGNLPGTGEQEARYQEIRWTPENSSLPAGPYLLETSATLSDGRVIGNRSLLFFNELVLHRKLTNKDFTLKAFTMADSKPVAAAKVTIIDSNNVLLGEGITNAAGSLTLPRSKLEPDGNHQPAYILVDSDVGHGIQPYQGARFISSGYAKFQRQRIAEDSSLVSHAFADRNLYRPGDTVYVKGTMRLATANGLTMPEGSVQWQVQEGWDGPPLASGKANLDAYGGWEATWESPKSAKLGDYRLSYHFDNNDNNVIPFSIEEYKPPLFDVKISDAKSGQVAVTSHYFHGSPNAGAKLRWQANWSPSYMMEEGFEESDHHSPFRHEPVSAIDREGETRLNAQGEAWIDLPVPFEKPLTYGRYQVHFTAEILSPEGQVIEAMRALEIRPHPHFASIQWQRASDETPNDRDLFVHTRTFDNEKQETSGLPMELTIYRQETQTVKERLGNEVYRYRNFPHYHSVHTATVMSGEAYRFTPIETGHYVAYAKLKGDPTAPAVSATIHSVGDGVGLYDVYNDGEITLQLDKESYLAGQDTAQIALESPFGGQAWVTVETDHIIDQFLTNLPANNQTIPLPVKPSYHPNVHVSVYLLHPGGPDRLPQERYGTVTLKVERPDLVFDVTPSLSSSDIQPGEEVNGVVHVTCQGQPALDADITVFAVDESVHRLGHWQMPDWFVAMYPQRYLHVASYRGLDEHFEKFEEREVTEKGFIIGGGSYALEDSGSVAEVSFRKDFRALAFWKTNLLTDAEGKATFAFKAPDNLTSFHLVAVAQSKTHQFGQGDTTFRVNKRLMVETALPRFVRRGDAIELRAVLRQDYLPSTPVVVSCQVDGLIEALGTQAQSLVLAKGVPQVVRFPHKVLGGDTIRVRFEAHSETDLSLTDAVDISVPVHLPGIVQRTGLYGVIPKQQAAFPLLEKLPEPWQSTTGSYEMTLSHTPYLPELNSLPEVLDYPHGCLEQKSTRFLNYAIMIDLLDYLPELKNRHANYHQRLTEGLSEFDAALLGSGFIGYWTGSDNPNDWVTVMAYWLINTLKAQGMEVPERLDTGLAKAWETIANGRRTSPSIDLTTRAFSLFVHAETGQPADSAKALLSDLYSRRGDLSLDGLALLTLAMNRFEIMKPEQAQLAKVLASASADRDREFDPITFGSVHRDRALRWLCKTRLASSKERRQLSNDFLKECEDTGVLALSTQEHFWKTLVLKEFVTLDKEATFNQSAVSPQPDFVSTNLASLAWKTQPLEHLRDLKLELGSSKADRHYFVSANVLRSSDLVEQEDRGFRLERVITNLTDASRVGTEKSPYQIGDELLLSYRFHTPKHHHYVALTDELPAGIETVNFNLPQVAQVYQLPDDTKATLWLSHSELRDQSANLYFDHVPAGQHQYAILARVTAAGSFTWPSTQISPMYLPHVGGLTPSHTAHSRDDH